MNKTLNFIFVSIALAFTGCTSVGLPQNNPVNLTKHGTCNYATIQGTEYALAPQFKQYVTNHFFYDEKTEKYSQLSKDKYIDLVNNAFKISKLDVVTAEDIKNKAPYLDAYRYEEVSFNGIPYKKDKTYSTQVITSNCSVFYLAGDTSKSSMQSNIIHKDGSQLSDDEIKSFISPLALHVVNFDAIKSHDNFKKLTKIETPSFDDLMIRGALKDRDNKILFIQLYADLTFFNDWGHISQAYDTDGKTHEVVSINTNVDCSHSDMFGCRLTETVGADLNMKFLLNHPDGFEMKFSGSQERIVKVPKVMVQSFLAAIGSGK